MEEQRRETLLDLCAFHEDSVERLACELRLTPRSAGCSTRSTQDERIKCLEELVEGLMRMLPAIVAYQVKAIVADHMKKELTPKLHR
jgi:hypothetical protein